VVAGRRGGDEEARRTTASSERVGLLGFDAGMQICTTAEVSFTSSLQGPRLLASLDQEEGWVR
jgi:hypothetical protein